METAAAMEPTDFLGIFAAALRPRPSTAAPPDRPGEWRVRGFMTAVQRQQGRSGDARRPRDERHEDAHNERHGVRRPTPVRAADLPGYWATRRVELLPSTH